MTFDSFLRDIAILRRGLLGKRVDFESIQSVTREQADRAAAFTLCAHGLIEAFIEWQCMEVATRAKDHFKTTGEVNLCCLSLLRYTSVLNQPPPDTFSKIDGYFNYVPANVHRNFVTSAYNAYIKVLDNNNGIKERNLRALLVPIGIDMLLIDATWLAYMESYGKRRGEFAHYGRTKSQLAILHPKDEYGELKNLLPGLKDLNIALQNLN